MQALRLSRPHNRWQRVTLGLLAAKLGIGAVVLGVVGAGWTPAPTSLPAKAQAGCITVVAEKVSATVSSAASLRETRHHVRLPVLASATSASVPLTSAGGGTLAVAASAPALSTDPACAHVGGGAPVSPTLEFAARTSRTRGQPVGA